MGIYAKSLSFTRYFVRGETPTDFYSWVDERLQAFLFREIDDTTDEKAWGWVELDNLLQTSFGSGEAHKGEYLAFSLRLDTRKVPAAVFRKHYLLAERALLQEQKFRRLSRNQKVELKKTVLQDLLRRQLPQPGLYDVVWHPGRQRLWLFATSPKVREIFETLFRETFEMDLYLLFPYTLAQDNLDAAALDKLELLEPAVFALTGARP
ncbi:MAG: recombination-associated protein RdgC [Desulfobacca sp.]|uniref:recombination-associated protein RdgC n=1 Tax=Desulfobacca sp. TaxID=2067990 RepID=UPI004049A097